MRPIPKRPDEILRDQAAPRELVEWVRKMPAADAPSVAWIDVSRADWLPYIAALRGFSHDAILKATCVCILELLPGGDDATTVRLLDIVRAGAEHGRASLGTADATLEDLRLTVIANGTGPSTPQWTPLAKLVLELTRAATRGNPLIGPALALRMLIDTRGKRSNTALIARFRDTLVLRG